MAITKIRHVWTWRVRIGVPGDGIRYVCAVATRALAERIAGMAVEPTVDPADIVPALARPGVVFNATDGYKRGPRAKLWGMDHFGNPLLEGELVIDGTYVLKATMHGEAHQESTHLRTYPEARRKFDELKAQWRDATHGWESKIKRVKVRAFWKDTYRPKRVVGHCRPRKRKDGTERYHEDQMLAKLLDAPTDSGRLFGDLGMDEVTVDLAESWTQQRRAMLIEKWQVKPKRGRRWAVEGDRVRPVAEGTVKRELAVFTAMWNYALESGGPHGVKVNPWRKVKRKKNKQGKTGYDVKTQTLSIGDQWRVYDALEPKYQRLLLFLLGTGLRLDGMRQLAMSPEAKIDFPGSKLFTRLKGGRWEWVKIVDPLVLDIIQEQLTECGQLWPENGSWILKTFYIACGKAGVPRFSPHVLRHTFGARWMQTDGRTSHLAKVLGDTVEVTDQHYAHLTLDDVGKRAGQLDLGLRRPEARGKVLAFEGR